MDPDGSQRKQIYIMRNALIFSFDCACVSGNFALSLPLTDLGLGPVVK